MSDPRIRCNAQPGAACCGILRRACALRSQSGAGAPEFAVPCATISRDAGRPGSQIRRCGGVDQALHVWKKCRKEADAVGSELQTGIR